MTSTTEARQEVQVGTDGRPSLEQMRETVSDLSMYLHDFYRVDFPAANAGDYEDDADTRRRVMLGPDADVISSRIRNGESDGKHTLMVDIDGPVAATPTPSGMVVVLGLTHDPFGFRTPTMLNDAAALLVATGIADAAGLLTLPNGKTETLAFCTQHPVRVLPTSTRGHHHLYVDVALPFEHLLSVLRSLALLNVVENGFVSVTEQRGAAHLRLPWVRKVVTR